MKNVIDKINQAMNQRLNKLMDWWQTGNILFLSIINMHIYMMYVLFQQDIQGNPTILYNLNI